MNTGRIQPKKQEPLKSYAEGTLEAEGYTIRKVSKGSTLIFYWINKDENGAEKLEAIETVGESQKWLTDTADAWLIDIEILKAAKAKALSTPKKNKEEEKSKFSSPLIEIITTKITQLTPDSGVIEGRPYLGIWLMAKVHEEETVKIKPVFHLLFSDGELVPCDSDVLNKKDIILQSQPIYTPLRVNIETVTNLAELPKINPNGLLNDLLKIISKYIEFDDPRCYTLVTYWIIATYFHKQFSALGYLFINALKRCGKTKLLEVINLLAYNAIFSPNMSTSSLFRLTQSAGITTLLDESEDLNDPEKKAEFKSLLLSGYKKGAFVYRSEKGDNDSRIPTPYAVYSPKAIANINGLDNVLEDRCIPLTMKRGKNLAIINKDIPVNDPLWIKLRDDLTRFYFQECNEIKAVYDEAENIEYILKPSVVSVVSVNSVVSKRVLEKKKLYVSRSWELWRPLFTVAKYISTFFSFTDFNYTNYTNYTNNTKTPFDDLLDLSVDLLSEKEAETDDTAEALLIMGLISLVKADKYYKPREIIDSAAKFSDTTLPDWFCPKWVGRTLKRLGFKDKRRIGKGTEYHFTPETVKDTAERLNIKLPEDEPPKKPEIFVFKETRHNEIHKCDNCQGLEAAYQQILNEEQKQKVQKDVLFFCKSCFDAARAKAEAEGIRCTIEENTETNLPKTNEVTSNNYNQLICYFCNKPINDNDWVKDDFSCGKPAHKKCSDNKREELNLLDGGA